MAKVKKVIRKNLSNRQGYTSDVPGVYFRDDGNPRWIVRFRYNRKDYLPQVHYPVDLSETNKSAPMHVDTAKNDAEIYAKQQAGALRKNKKPLALYGAHWTLGALFERVLKDFDEGKIDLKSKSIQSNLRVWLGTAAKGQNKGGFPTLTQKRLTELDKKDFYNKSGDTAFNHLLKDANGKKASNSAVKKHLKSVQFAFKRASNDYEIDFKDPLTTLKNIQASDARERTLTADEWELITADMRASKCDQSTIAAIQFARYTAVRRSEAIKLDWADINFKDQTAHLRGTKAKRGAYKERVIPLNGKPMEILRSLHETTRDKNGPVFAHSYMENWKRLRPDTTTQAWSRSRARVVENNKGNKVIAEIMTARVHDLRHTRITELGSMPEITVSEAARISGHEDLKSFMRYFNPSAVSMGKKIEANERSKMPREGGGTLQEAVDALVALGNKDDLYKAFVTAMQKIAPA